MFMKLLSILYSRFPHSPLRPAISYKLTIYFHSSSYIFSTKQGPYLILTTTTPTCSTCRMTTIKKQRITLFMNSSITKHAKAQAALEDTSLTTLVEKALTRYLPKKLLLGRPKS